MESSCILTVTPDGQFMWADNADELIETGDFSATPAMPHILKRLREVEKYRSALTQARDALKTCSNDGYFIDHDCDKTDAALAAINKVLEEK